MSKYFEKNLKKTFKRTLNNFRPKSRKGLGMGLGKGFKNMIPQDPFVHSMSARGVKTGEKISIVKTDMSDWKWNLRFIRHGLYAGDGKFFKTKKVAEKYARKYMKLNAKGISEEMLEKFGRLDGEFSPENLTCDGELSNLQVRKKYAMLMREWRALEKEVGHKVSRDEVEDWLIKKLNAKGKVPEGWVQDISRNPYRGFRFEKGEYAVIGQKYKGQYIFAVQKLSGGFPTSKVDFKYVRSKEQALQLAKRLMADVDKGNTPFQKSGEVVTKSNEGY